MTKNKIGNRYAPAVRARTVRIVFEHQGSYDNQVTEIAAKIGCIPQTLRGWVTQTEKYSGMRDGVTQSSVAGSKRLNARTESYVKPMWFFPS
jgi:transposase-like protein